MTTYTVKDIKAKFPVPNKIETTSGGVTPTYQLGQYCVLGAAIMYKQNTTPEKATYDIRFPTVDVAARLLGISHAEAEIISEDNDEGMFADAWDRLHQALSRACTPWAPTNE